MIWSGLLVLAGLATTVAGALTPGMIEQFLPEKYVIFAPLILSVIGFITGYLRYITDTAFGQKHEDE